MVARTVLGIPKQTKPKIYDHVAMPEAAKCVFC